MLNVALWRSDLGPRPNLCAQYFIWKYNKWELISYSFIHISEQSWKKETIYFIFFIYTVCLVKKQVGLNLWFKLIDTLFFDLLWFWDVHRFERKWEPFSFLMWTVVKFCIYYRFCSCFVFCIRQWSLFVLLQINKKPKIIQAGQLASLHLWSELCTSIFCAPSWPSLLLTNATLLRAEF